MADHDDDALLAEFYPIPLAMDRFKQIEKELREYVDEEISFSFDPSGTDLFSLMELRQSYARRCVNFSETIKLLLKAGSVVPAAILGRALIETVAMGSLFLTEMLDLTAKKNGEKLNVRLTRFYQGMSKEEVKPVHVMDAIRHLDKLDAAYIEHLDKRFGWFTRAKEVLAQEKPDKPNALQDAMSIEANYDRLSEVAHPNGIGVQFLYPDPSNENDVVEGARQRYRRAAFQSIWQCKHLLDALDKTKDLPDKFRDAFIS